MAALHQEADRLIREHAVRASAIGHDLLVAWEFHQTPLKLINGNRPSADDVTLLELDAWADIKHDDPALSNLSNQLLLRDRRQGCAISEVRLDQAINFSDLTRSNVPQRPQELRDFRVGEAVDDEESTLLGLDQPCPSQDLKVSRRISRSVSGRLLP